MKKKIKKATDVASGISPEIGLPEILQEELRQAREKAENVAKLYTDLYVEIYNFSPAGYFSLDPDGKICELNINGAKMLSKDRTSLINRYFNQFIAEESRPGFNNFFKRLYRKTSKESCEVIVRNPDNNPIYLHVEGIVSEVEQKCLLALVDITEHKLMEVELRESEAKFRNLFEHLPIGVSMTGLQGSMNVNKALCKILGYNKEELMAKTWMAITHPEDIEKTNEQINLLRSGKVPQVKFEKRFIHKSGKIVTVELTSYLEKDKAGNPQYMITAVIDLTKVTPS